MTFFAPVQLATSPKSNHVIWLVKDFASRSVVKPGFSTFGVEVASSTSSPIKLGSLASPRARRLRRRTSGVATGTAGVSGAGATTAAETVSLFLVAVPSVPLLLGFVVPSATAGVATGAFSSTGAVSGAVTGASAWYVVAEVETSLVVETVAAVVVAGWPASSFVATSTWFSVFSSAATLEAVPTITSVPKRTEHTPTFNFRIENLLIRSLNKSLLT